MLLKKKWGLVGSSLENFNLVLSPLDLSSPMLLYVCHVHLIMLLYRCVFSRWLPWSALCHRFQAQSRQNAAVTWSPVAKRNENFNLA